MSKTKKYPRVLIGFNDKEPIYLSPPSWDCGWYWGFGYLGNSNCHYHMDGLSKKHGNINIKDAIDQEFGESYIIRPSHRWNVAELIKNFYDLKDAAYILGQGGSHLTTSPSKNIILNIDEAKRINDIVLPNVFEELYKIISRNLNNDDLFRKLIEIDLKGDSSRTLQFMKENSINPDDLILLFPNDYTKRKFIKGITKDDYNRLHGIYWKDYHSNKNK